MLLIVYSLISSMMLALLHMYLLSIMPISKGVTAYIECYLVDEGSSVDCNYQRY
jgi:hypothetical protein